MARPDFTLKWASSRLSIPAISSGNYAAGWDTYLGPLPPLGDDHDYVMNLQDSRAIWLGEQMLLAVGHEWQDDVSYDAYAVVRSPVNGQLYRSLVGSNLNNEPSVSGSQWALGIGEEIPDTLSTSGVSGVASNLKLSATGLSAVVTVTANAVCLKNAINEPAVINTVSVTPSLAASGANGLDTGTSAINTWYSVWVIWNGTTTAGLLSTSATAPTLPSGYTHKARVGWVRSDSNASNKFPLGFIQYGNSVQYKISAGSNLAAHPLMASGTAGFVSAAASMVSVAVGAFAPPTASEIFFSISNPSSASCVAIAGQSNTFSEYNSLTNPPPVGISGLSGLVLSPLKTSLLLESTNIFWASSNSSGRMFAIGWKDNI